MAHTLANPTIPGQSNSSAPAPTSQSGAPDTTAIEAAGVYVWLPRDRMVRYQWGKIATGTLMGMTFAGWLVLQWSSVPARLAIGGLLILTVWVVASSVLSDARRMRGRSISLRPGAADPGSLLLEITQPSGRLAIDLSEVAAGAWCDDPENRPGLSLYSRHDEPLASLDYDFLADEAEARLFLRWLRTHSDTNFPVRWPDPGA